MLRFLVGILVVQVASVALLMVAGFDPGDWHAGLPFVFALAMIGLVAAFWFSTVAAGQRRDALERLRGDFAREREDLRVKAEKEKTRLLQTGHRAMASATRRAESRANRKVALAVVATSAAGVLMIAASFMTVGLLLLAGAGGGVGGYIAGRRSALKTLPNDDIESHLPTPPRRLRVRRQEPPTD